MKRSICTHVQGTVGLATNGASLQTCLIKSILIKTEIVVCKTKNGKKLWDFLEHSDCARLFVFPLPWKNQMLPRESSKAASTEDGIPCQCREARAG